MFVNEFWRRRIVDWYCSGAAAGAGHKDEKDSGASQAKKAAKILWDNYYKSRPSELATYLPSPLEAISS
jgi:Fe-S oxidoreductase